MSEFTYVGYVYLNVTFQRLFIDMSVNIFTGHGIMHSMGLHGFIKRLIVRCHAYA